MHTHTSSCPSPYPPNGLIKITILPEKTAGVSLVPSLTRVRILSYLYVLPMDHYRSNGRFTLRPRSTLQPTSLFLDNTAWSFQLCDPSVSPIDDGLSAGPVTEAKVPTATQAVLR